MLNRTVLTFVLGFGLILVIAVTELRADSPLIGSAELPNVVVFLSDDQGYGDFSYTGNQDLETPNIDGLAREGAFFENFYVCPVCSPTRAEFLTGRYHPRGGVYSTSAGGERLDLEEFTIAEAFKSAGYATAAFGKWHNGMQAPYHPNTRGFDEFYGFCSGHWGHYFDPLLEHNGSLVRGRGYIVDDLTDHAIKFIEENVRRPFFVFLPYNIPHSPMQVPDKYWDRFADKQLTQLPMEAQRNNRKDSGIDHARAALAMCENIDDNVGRVLSKLDELKIADNTIVVYFSDNGPNGPRYNAGLKGRKGSTDEGGVRSPLFVRWPAKIKPGTKMPMVTGAIDLFPTLTGLCGLDVHPHNPFDGISFALDLKGAKVKRSPRLLFSYWNNKLSVRSQIYRLDDKNQLYNMMTDREQNNPVVDRPEIRKELMAAARDWRMEVLSELEQVQRPFSVGHRGLLNTQLPARDAKATGAIKRSNRFPNCSYFTNWVNTNDTISWPVNVVEGGIFKVELYYCCAESDVGTMLELSLGNERLETSISVANDPPLIGAEQDRAIRAESLVKNFKPVEMGVIELPAGDGELTLRATKIPGQQSIEFRLLMLTRVE